MALVDQTYRQQARACFHQAQAPNLDPDGAHLTVAALTGQYAATPAAWAMGPFQQDPSLTFHKPSVWADPLAIGWDSRFLWNPTLIADHESLYLFYRSGPRRESLSSRIGVAIWNGEGWADFPGNPLLYSCRPNELLGCEDPKIYKHDQTFYLFYNGVYPLPLEAEQVPPTERFEAGIACDINLAISRDLLHWERVGVVVPHAVSRYWAKGAVIARNSMGSAVACEGQFVMFLSEGCGNQQYFGYSPDLIHWTFEPQTYLQLPPGWGQIHEVACVTAVTSNRWVMDVFYRTPAGQPAACQVLYDPHDLTTPLAFSRGGTLAWGGVIQFQGQWLFAQGWDASDGEQAMYFYRAPIEA